MPDEADPRSDRDLIAAVAGGDRAAFVALVARYRGPVLRVARALTRDDAHAEDVLQETFLAAFRSAASFRGEATSAGPWLYAIARHAAFRIARRDREVVADDRALELLGREAGWGTEDVERAAARAQLRAHLADALAALGPEDREVLTLHDGLGLSGEETAATIHVTLAAMKSRLHRARLRLAGALRHQKGALDVG